MKKFVLQILKIKKYLSSPLKLIGNSYIYSSIIDEFSVSINTVNKLHSWSLTFPKTGVNISTFTPLTEVSYKNQSKLIISIVS